MGWYVLETDGVGGRSKTMDNRGTTERIETSGIIAGTAFTLLIILSLLVVGAIFFGF